MCIRDSLKKQLARNEKRIVDLKRLFMKIYEDNANGKPVSYTHLDVYKRQGKRPARPPHEQGNYVQNRGHLCHFSGRDAHDGLGVRAHHCGAVLFV